MYLTQGSRSSLCALVLAASGYVLVPASSSEGAQWLAPAAEERITAGWVKDVARQLRKERFKNVFVNQPFGCDQCRILNYLNDAADALEADQPRLAKSFVKRALGVLKDGKEQGWYSDADIRPIKRLIVHRAQEAFKDSGSGQLAGAVPDQRRDQRYASGADPLFSRSHGGEAYGDRGDRWTGYTDDHQYGLTRRLDPSRAGEDRHSRQAARGQDQFQDRSRDLRDHDWNRLAPHDDWRWSEGSSSQNGMQSDSGQHSDGRG